MSRGINRERMVRALLEDDDYWVARAAGSFGEADLIALKAGHQARMIEVKSDARGPYVHFGPKDRNRILLAAFLAGASAELAWWPPRGQLHWIPSSEWPQERLRRIA